MAFKKQNICLEKMQKQQKTNSDKNNGKENSYNIPIRGRAVFTGIFFAALISIASPYNNAYLNASLLGGGHFPMAPFFIMICLTLLAAFANIHICKQNLLLTGKELLHIWILMALVSGIAYTGLVRTFFINLSIPFHYAETNSNWSDEIIPYLPKALYPQNSEAVAMLYDGIDRGYKMGLFEIISQIPWNVWILPLLVWTLFIFLSYFVMICTVNIFSRQWFHNERLHMPLVNVPVMLQKAVDQNKLLTFLSNPFFIIGISIPLLYHLINGLNFYYPSVPKIPSLILAGSYFPKYGFLSGFNKLKIFIYPAFIGFAFLTARQISFSFWFFFIAGSFLFGALHTLGYNIPAAALGVTFGPTLSRPEETQMIGAYFIFFLFIIWLARKHLVNILKESCCMIKKNPDRTEWFNTAVSFWGFVAGFFGIVLWCFYFGMPLLTSFLTVGMFFMILIVSTRVICQGALAYFTLTAAPIDSLMALFGANFFTKTGILIAGVAQKVLFVDLRESLMPSLVHARKVDQLYHNATKPCKKNRNMLFASIIITIVVGVAVSFASMLVVCYKYGIRDLHLDWASRTTVSVYKNIHTLIITPADPNIWVLIFSGFGAFTMLVLVIGYHRFYKWPFHPIGYLTAYSSAMKILWFSFFVGWICNALCMRYGGIILFKKIRYFFVGLIIGDFLMGGAWALLGFLKDTSYQVFPN